MQNEAEERDSRVSKSLPVRNIFLVSCLFSMGNNNYCVLLRDKEWLLSSFSISPLDLPLKPDLFVAKHEPFWG